MYNLKRILMVLAAVAVLVPAFVFAASAKKYQVTGKVLEVSDSMIVVEKDDEKWEINRDPSLKSAPAPKVGEKVTIQYKMVATGIEVKAEKKK